ncbi:C13 family peptidase [Methylovirgula sp. 4M-Z18]|uniref:C13 family peptidase n=1 Tax=Methylovirgula sp. 4M-Z18 TaxID=2293567 RepID=UPI001FE025C6|nr:C13 family peptidase [Methylovirgula sp. 4M-Z18]
MHVVAYALWGDQSVFRSEATLAADIVLRKYAHGDKLVRANTRRDGPATAEQLVSDLQRIGAKADDENDVLFLILTSHGDTQGIGIVTPRREQLLPPAGLKALIDESGIRHRVVIISACYSGVFVPALADPNTLVITAADADHSSFGCRDGAKWTYFGEALFDQAMRRGGGLKDVFATARSLIAEREAAEGFPPSNPQMAGGENVLPLLDQ